MPKCQSDFYYHIQCVSINSFVLKNFFLESRMYLQENVGTALHDRQAREDVPSQ